MMTGRLQIKPLSSGSHGNCYLVEDGMTAVLLECGIPIQKIRQGLDYQLSKVNACLISHEHGDHALAVQKILEAGIDTYMTTGTRDALELQHHRVHAVEEYAVYQVGNCHIMPVPVVHDAAQPVGYIVASTKNKLLFATDTAYMPVKVPKLTHLMIECNHDKNIVIENMRNKTINKEYANRLASSHMEFSVLMAWLEELEKSALEEIWLLHYSVMNCDPLKCQKQIEARFGIPCYIA